MNVFKIDQSAPSLHKLWQQTVASLSPNLTSAKQIKLFFMNDTLLIGMGKPSALISPNTPFTINLQNLESSEAPMLDSPVAHCHLARDTNWQPLRYKSTSLTFGLPGTQVAHLLSLKAHRNKAGYTGPDANIPSGDWIGSIVTLIP